ncbi:amidohydrolase [[Clostridium] sordellii]|uniref:amidohydrolase n=1 Tax=Paraclostridium sordellii TaxID=1505 RepID=UPI0005DD9136|nr:amidohydrolase family protein [Paeniclostridium sordellii]CEP89406.1 amidohydrolase [[Clostridium] sordellii] [Paeniclostridium sordellii]
MIFKSELEVPKGESKDYCGYATQEDKDVIEYFKSLIENNIQVNVHCNGDAASDQFIRCYKKALEMTDNKTDLRPVMVHAQTVREDQLDGMKELGIIPTFFLDHIWFWGDYHYESVFGPERANRLSPAKSALRRNISFTLHQDSPVKMLNQILAMHNAVNRQTQSGRILGADQRLSIMEAIKALTINAAYQYFEEDEKGSIEEGKVADFVILDRNPLDVDSSEIKSIKILETIKEGNTIYKK